MKKALVILFALGLVFSFSAPVMATDVSFDGSFRVRGWLDSNSALAEGSVSNAYYDQRFRLGGVFQVAEGLKVTVRGDVLDGIWGNQTPGATMRGNTANNVQFDMAYVTFMTGVGQVQAGYMSDGTWGLGFGNLETFVGKIDFATKVGGMVVGLQATKPEEADNGTVYSDRDSDSYRAYLVYAGETTTAGLLYVYGRNANDPNGLNGVLMFLGIDPMLKATSHVVAPYFKATIGDLYLEGEAGWLKGEISTGDLTAAELAALNGFLGTALTGDIELEGLRAYVKAQYNLGSAYVGGLFAYVQGDDPNTANKVENILNSGGDWDPMLILFNDTCPTALGTVGTTGTSMTNGYLYQAFAGTTIDKLSLKASLSYAKADEKPTGFVDDVYGTEFDVEAAYKIYDNLTYSAGFGYLWAGDYYKGAAPLTKVDNTYLLMNKLQVNF